MGVKHAMARALVTCLPTDTGLWRLKRILPGVPDPANLVTTKLRGYPLQFKFRPGTYIGWYLYYRGMYEEQAVGVCAQLLREGMNFVDVGANYGLYSVVAASKVGPRGRVAAVEPQPELVQRLADNIAINSLKNVVVKSCAMGAEPGTALLHRPSRTNDGAAALRLGEHEQSFGEPTPVAVETLPQVLEECAIPSIEGMKIDVEGAELAVLQGAAPLLSQQQPEFILLECIDEHLKRFGGSSDALLSFLWDFGYRTACLYRGRWRTVSSHADYTKYHGSPDVLVVHPETRSWDVAAKLFRR